MQQKQIQQPSAAFIAASWFALLAGTIAFIIGLWNAEMELNEKTWFLVRETPGVGDFVGAHGTPTKMTNDEVSKMLGQETAKTKEVAPIKYDFERGDRVKIKDGPFENFEGSVEDVVEQRGVVKVMLIIFNRPTPVELEYWQVERI